MLLNNEQITEEIKKEIKIFIETNENENTTPMDRSAKQKISKERQNLNDTMDQWHLVDIYRILHHKTMNFIFSQVHTESLQDKSHPGS